MASGSGYSQATRLIGVSTPLGDDVLLLRGMAVRERLSALFEIELDLLSENEQIAAADLLGQSVTVRLEMQNQATRYFNGYVNRFAHAGFEGRLTRYQATLVPWLWLLTRTSDCRIFQEMTVPDIVKQVLGDAGFSDIDDRLSGEYGVRDYCVQYRESHFNFVSRLLEHEGIYWYFAHEDGKHSLVLADGYSSHQAFPGYDTIRYHPADLAAERDRDFIHLWAAASALRSGAFVHDDFDFKKPSAELRSNATMTRSHAHADYEVYDYPGAYVATGEGQRYAGIRMEELQCDQQIARGESYCRGLAVGCLFSLVDYPRSDQNREYLLTSVQHSLKTDAFQSGGDAAASEMLYQSSFAAMDAREPFRAPRVTPKPTVNGPQTAIVVGPAGEEIWTDEYGRVKVQFHWDRYGQMDQNSSCWVRVSQPWAGQNWGAIHIPRIGQEIIVDFLEGDPDRPIITGRVYNAEQMPPWGLPGGGVVSGFKSDTHKGGGYNELSMDDTAGKEKITIHGQYDMNTTVEHDQTSTIHNNRTDMIGVDDSETVGANQSVTIGGNQTIDIGGSRTETVGGAETISIGGHRTETVGGGETVTVSGGRSHSVSGTQTTTISVAEAHSVGAGRMHNVGGGEAISVGGVQAINVGGVQTVSVGGAQMVNVGALQSVSVGGAHKLSAAVISETSKGPVKITAGAICVVEAPTIVLKAGGSQIILDAGGVTIKGAKITVKANGNVTINGPGGIKLKGATIGEN